MTREEFNKKWPMSKIPDAIREVVVTWGDAHHWFIEDKVKLAKDILEATDKLMSEQVRKRSMAYIDWLDKRISEMESKQKGWETSYSDIMDRGALHELKVVREKYLSTLPPPQSTN